MNLPLNQIIEGDCLEVMKTFPDKSFDLVLTDPPYGMAYQSSRRTDKHAFIDSDDEGNTEWVVPFLKEAYRVLKDDTHLYVFCNDYLFAEIRKWIEPCGFTLKRTLVWVKNNHTSGDLEGDYANKTEWIIFAHKGRRLLNGSRDTNVLSFARESDTDNHPTPKPPELIEYLISKSTNEGDIVLDPFLGSGTTLIAAQHLKRNAVGIEIDPQYAQFARDRLSAQSNPLF